LARVCQLTYKTLAAKLKADQDQSKVCADLIVFPEVALHQDDQDLIKRLADKTKAIVFAGLVFLDHDGKLVNLARWFIPDYRRSGRQWITRDQGKQNMTNAEKHLGISGYRPCQHIIELLGAEEGPIRISGAICYDATDLNLAADLKKKTDLFVVSAHNKDVSTFDTMAAALNYHMYQHVVVVNKGEFGGSTVQAPFREHYARLVSHVHGSDQISINVADLDLAAFRREHKSYKPVKTKPAGM
jgi:predicted amidohydrolase